MNSAALSLESFLLPLARMREEAPAAATRYSAARPFQHVMLDDFLDPQLLDQVLAEFPSPKAICWQRFEN